MHRSLIHLLDTHRPDRGVIIDLGDDHAAVAGPALELGFSSTRIHGDANDLDSLAERLDEAAAGRPVAAVIAIDVLQQLMRPDDTLRVLHSWLHAQEGSPVLAVGVPNVGHVDLAAKLLTGRWDVTPTGLIGEANVRLFTDRSLDAMMTGSGFDETARNDVALALSDQAWPPDHPALSSGSMLGRYIRTLRESTDDHAETSHFVRVFSPQPAPLEEVTPHSAFTVTPVAERRSPFLSVITRTTGNRLTLVDTLACLAAQTDADFEVLLMINTDDGAACDSVVELIASFDSSFRDRIRVDVSTEMHRVAPLNRALALARGRYVTILDDDDVVFGDWVEQFHHAADAHPGAVVRCRAVDQRIDTVGTDGPAVATSGFDVPYRPTFDLASHLAGGQSPPATLAVPCEAVDTFRLRFDEDMIVCEDIEFYLRATSICGVVDTGTFGMVYRRWTDRFASQHTVSPEVWEQSIQEIVRRLDTTPLLMPAGTASRLYQAAVQERQLHELDQGASTLLRRVGVAERNWASLADAYAHLEREFHIVTDDRDRWQEQAEQLTADGWTAPLRRVVRRGRRMLPGGSST
jgi:hypothetical protein